MHQNPITINLRFGGLSLYNLGLWETQTMSKHKQYREHTLLSVAADVDAAARRPQHYLHSICTVFGLISNLEMI